MRTHHEQTAGDTRKRIDHLERSITGILDIRAAEELIKDHHHPPLLADLLDYLLHPPHLGIEMTIPLTDAVRQGDRRHQPIKYRGFKRTRRNRKTHMR